MTEKKKNWLRPQIIFPSVIALTFAVVIIISAFYNPAKTFTAVKTDDPTAMSMSWSDIDEETFYKKMSIAVHAQIQSGPDYYDLIQPGFDMTIPIATYDIWVGDVLISTRTKGFLGVDEINPKIHSVPSAFTDAGITTEPEKNMFILFLSDQRDDPDVEPQKGLSASYYDDYFDMFGYALITPSCSVFPAVYDDTGPMVLTSLLPEYLQGKGEYTTLNELRDILYAGRKKYGMTEGTKDNFL